MRPANRRRVRGASSWGWLKSRRQAATSGGFCARPVRGCSRSIPNCSRPLKRPARSTTVPIHVSDARLWPSLDADVYVPSLVERDFGNGLVAAAGGPPRRPAANESESGCGAPGGSSNSQRCPADEERRTSLVLDHLRRRPPLRHRAFIFGRRKSRVASVVRELESETLDRRARSSPVHSLCPS